MITEALALPLNLLSPASYFSAETQRVKRGNLWTSKRDPVLPVPIGMGLENRSESIDGIQCRNIYVAAYSFIAPITTLSTTDRTGCLEGQWGRSLELLDQPAQVHRWNYRSLLKRTVFDLSHLSQSPALKEIHRLPKLAGIDNHPLSLPFCIARHITLQSLRYRLRYRC